MSWIVERESALGLNAAYTGPMSTMPHAERERDAWLECGYRARVIEYDADVRAKVRRWMKGERWPYDVETDAS